MSDWSRMPRTLCLVLALLPALVGAMACGSGRRSQQRPNVLLVSLDTVRADHTSLLGYARKTTPHLEALAREGAVFTRAYTMSSTTGPSHATLFTGLYAPEHGVAHNGMPLPAKAVTMAEYLQARGYRTAGFVSSFVLAKQFGFGQGFAHYDDEFDAEGSSLPLRVWERHVVPGGAFDRSGARTTDRAVAWLEHNAGQPEPFFVFVHYFDAHEPYAALPAEQKALAASGPPAPSDEVDRYDGEIRYVDEQVGRLLDTLDKLGVAKSTWVIVVNDHGQGLTNHNDAYHSINIYEECVRGVFVVRGPGGVAGVVSDAPIEHVDVLPTVLDLVAPGSEAGLGLPGKSLVAELAGHRTLKRGRPIYVYRQLYPLPGVVRGTRVVGEQFGIRVGRWKYIEGTEDGVRELYDLTKDPGELRNLADEAPDERRHLAQRLDGWEAGLKKHSLRASAPRPSREDRRKLQALGYLQAK